MVKRIERLRRFIWAWAIFWPLLVVWLDSFLQTVLRFGEPWQPDIGVLVLDSLIAALPFVLLAMVAPAHQRDPVRYGFSGVLVAMLLLMVAEALLWGSLLYSSLTYSGGGANIGLGLLLMFSPLYMPVLIPAGLWIGRFLPSSTP